MSRRPPSPSKRSRAHDTPVLDHVAGGGPDGGRVWSLAVTSGSPSRAFAAMWDGGVYASRDRGRTWAPADRGLPATTACDLVADPVAEATLYAACGDGFFKTIDGGALWRQLDLDNPGAPVIGPSNPQVLYQPTSGGGLLRSRDGGHHWRYVGSARRVSDCHSGFAIDPVDVSVLYCGSAKGVLVSRNGGARWRPLPGGPGPVEIQELAATPGRGRRLFVLTNDRKLFRYDSTAVWTALSVPEGSDLADLRVVDGEGRVLYAKQFDRIVRSLDGGVTWQALGSPGGRGAMSRFSVDASTPGVIYSGDFDGLFVTEDGGTTWARRMSGISRAAPSLAWHEADPPTLFAAVGTEVLASRDDGASWSAVSIDPTASAAGATWLSSDGAGGVIAQTRGHAFRLARGATAWTPDPRAVGARVNDGGDSTMPSVRVHPTTDGFQLSEDGGTTWRQLRGPWRGGDASRALAPTAVVRAGTDGRTLVAGIGGLMAVVAHERNSLWRSTDDGATWTRVFDLNIGIVAQCCGLSIDPESPDTVFAVASGMVIGGGGAEVWRSIDGGRTWARLPNGLFSGLFAVVPTSPTTLLGQPFDSGLVRSTDAGDHWTPADTGLPPGVDVTRIVSVPRRPHVLFAATASRGIYRSTDAGVSWQPVGRVVRDNP